MSKRNREGTSTPTTHAMSGQLCRRRLSKLPRVPPIYSPHNTAKNICFNTVSSDTPAKLKSLGCDTEKCNSQFSPDACYGEFSKSKNLLVAVSTCNGCYPLPEKGKMMMVMGDRFRSNPTVQIPPSDYHYLEDPTAHVSSPTAHTVSANSCTPSPYDDILTALQRYLPSNEEDGVVFPECKGSGDDFDVPVDAFSCDNFRIFEFKVRGCARARSHDWTACPFAHPGEKARRRDPRRYHYSGSACPDFRRGGACGRGDACEYAHGVFECWLHPARYRTQPCKDGTRCHRRVCFFAHTPEQLRVLPCAASPDVSPRRLGQESFAAASLFESSPRSAGSPPVSPNESMRTSLVNELSESIRRLQLNKMILGFEIGSPRSPPPALTRPGFQSQPSTPVHTPVPPRLGSFDGWATSCEEEPVMERVESGRELRERIYAKLGKENSLDRVGQVK